MYVLLYNTIGSLIYVARLYFRNCFMQMRQATTSGGKTSAKTRATIETVGVRLPSEVRHRLAGPRVLQVPDTSD